MFEQKLTETETLEFIWWNKKQEKFVLKLVNLKLDDRKLEKHY